MTMSAWLLVTMTWAAPLSIDEVPNPRTTDGWISDLADVLPDDEEATLNAYLQTIHDETGAEVAVVTVQDTLDEPKAFATGLFNHWGIGDARANNGLLVLLVMDRRRLEMETGYGLEGVLSDGWLGAMQAREMVPSFKAGDYAGGLKKGLKATGMELLAHADAVREGAPAPSTARPSSGPTSSPTGFGDTSWALVGGAAGGLGVLGLGGWYWLRRKERTCPTCNVLMEMIPEHEDDEHLTEGQQFEEDIHSVDYQVYVCGRCSFSKTIRVARWFSGYSDCRACGHRARTAVSTTVRAATYDAGGLVRVDEHCLFCDDSSSYMRSTPRLQRSSSSSSSRGGSSFGGGSSGGGGAGSSW